MTTYLGIDYGKKHLGLALADGPLARPLTSLNDLKNPELMARLSKIIADNSVDQIVVGQPEGELDQEVTQFGNKLANLTNIPVAFHPETLSTQEALKALRLSGAGQAKLRNDHVYAACIILEDFLETLPRT